MENQNENFAAQENQNPAQDAPQNTAPQQNPAPIKKIPKVNMIISAVSIVIIIVCAIVILNLVGGKTITMDEYNQIKTGMSYEDVCDIIGGEGELVSEAGGAAVYSWEGKGAPSANAAVSFYKGKVMAKAQAGLK